MGSSSHVPFTFVAASAASKRIELAQHWLDRQSSLAPLLVVGGSRLGAARLVRDWVSRTGHGALGWYCLGFTQLKHTLALGELSAAGLVAAPPLSVEALITRVLHRLAEGGKLTTLAQAIAQPNLGRVVARTLTELRMARVPLAALGDTPDLQQLLAAYEIGLQECDLADQALLAEAALRAIAAGTTPLAGLPLLLLDVPVGCLADAELVGALIKAASSSLCVLPSADGSSARWLDRVLGEGPVAQDAAAENALSRAQQRLFHDVDDGDQHPRDPSVSLLAASDGQRECVEIVRQVQRYLDQGLHADRIAVLLRGPARYRADLSEAFARAKIPAHFAEGTRQPDPAGRALLALLWCKAEGLSVTRFCEYLSLGELPPLSPSGEPPAAPAHDLLPPAGEQLSLFASYAVPDSAAPAADWADGPLDVVLSATRRWERLLIDAAVIGGGRSRWAKRLVGLQNDLRARLRLIEVDGGDGPQGDQLRRHLVQLLALEAFALPLVGDLEHLPQRAPWGIWLKLLGELANRALRAPDRVRDVLAELQPLASVGPVGVMEVLLVLERRLTEVGLPSHASEDGAVYVGAIEHSLGLSFDVVFVPGLVEREFPRRVLADPLLSDEARMRVSDGLATNPHRVQQERLCLQLAVGAARQALHASFPRTDEDKGRPRVPSFYALELHRAAFGVLPDFEQLLAQADLGQAHRLGWPAPEDPRSAIDDAEFDLAMLSRVFAEDAAAARGATQYLLAANPHLARSLRQHYQRWHAGWNSDDGLVLGRQYPRSLLAAHQLDARSFSPTALQNFALCPYRFYLNTIAKLKPRDTAEHLDSVDPLTLGSLLHSVLHETCLVLRERGMLPLSESRMETAQAILRDLFEGVVARAKEAFFPAIERVWAQDMQSLWADLSEWLQRLSDDAVWVPWRFELAFGLSAAQNAGEAFPAAVTLESGLSLRGAIDLVERRGNELRATDYKSGRCRTTRQTVINQGQTLQPVLYALALQQLFPQQTVAGGNLYYCTSRGGFQRHHVPLDGAAREAAALLTETLRAALEEGFLPALPTSRDGESVCGSCDYRQLCGTNEAQRVAGKPQQAPTLEGLKRMRRHK